MSVIAAIGMAVDVRLGLRCLRVVSGRLHAAMVIVFNYGRGAGHIGFPTDMMMTAARRHQRFVFHGRQRRQLLEQGNELPDVAVFHTPAPCRHTGGLDSMFDRPEILGRVALAVCVGQIWRRSNTCRDCSTASIASTRRAGKAARAMPGWAWRSPVRSSRRTMARSNAAAATAGRRSISCSA